MFVCWFLSSFKLIVPIMVSNKVNRFPKSPVNSLDFMSNFCINEAQRSET